MDPSDQGRRTSLVAVAQPARGRGVAGIAVGQQVGAPLRLVLGVFYAFFYFAFVLIAPALVMAPLLWLGVSRILVYNLVLLSGFVLSGVGAALLVRDLTRSAPAAVSPIVATTSSNVTFSSCWPRSALVVGVKMGDSILEPSTSPS